MRTATLLILFAIAAIAAPAALACDKCGKPPSATTKKSGKDKDIVAAHDAKRPGKTYEISVPDMGCDNCVKVLREKLKKIDGVIEVEGDLDKKTLKVGVEEGKELSEADAKKVIKAAGYTWGGIKEQGAKKECEDKAEKKPESSGKEAAPEPKVEKPAK